MVLGLRANNRRSHTLHRDFLILIQEIKPWPPSQSLRTVRSVLVQWEHGEKYSGSTNTVIPILGPGIGDGKIEFNESFKISVTLVRDISVKGGDSSTFQKSCLELNLYEPRRDKTVKGQLLGTAIVDFADYGVVKEAQSISVPINSKRIYNNTAKPLLYIKIQSIEKGRTSSSSRESLGKVPSMERNGGESVSALMNEEYAEEAEIASVTDDDVSSHSSVALSSSVFEINGGLSRHSHEVTSDSPSEVLNLPNLIPTQQLAGSDTKQVNEVHETESIEEDNGAIWASEMGTTALSGSESIISNDTLAEAHRDDDLDENSGLENSVVAHPDTEKDQSQLTEAMCQTASINIIHNGLVNNLDENIYQEKGHEGEVKSEEDHSNIQSNESSEDESIEQGSCAMNAVALSEEKLEFNSNTNRLNHVKSVRSSVESGKSNGSSVRNGKMVDDTNGPRGFTSHGKKETRIYTKETKSTYSDGKIIQLERRIKMLEGELREAAGVEVGLYSIVAEHGSSTNKVHAPARRLSRLYLHACKESSKSGRASAARSAASGLVIVAKACGSDVPRLTYWLSNTVVLRAIIEQQLPLYAGPLIETPSGRIGSHKKASPIRWEASKIIENINSFSGNFDDWDDPQTFTSALRRIEAWIFSRVIESIWWQTLTPHMQSAAAKAMNTDSDFVHSKAYRRTSSLDNQDQVNVSLELWKKAFKDACERLCPVRAGGHECGCLPVLARLIMEQCVARLDVAMFNAILRESDDEIPTDPVSDPIGDAKVLPIPAGKASFGAGAQLKNAVGNWSRWLTDLFGFEDDLRDENNFLDEEDDDESEDRDTSSKCFHLLNALSDLMMLPKDMLLSRSIRKEVCPTFGVSLINRVLGYFVPDEFCPDPIPEVVLEALDSEDPLEESDNLVRNFPCSAAPPIYMPPPASSLYSIIGAVGNEPQLRRSGSSVLRKSYTSDDELDELDSPLSAIINSFQSTNSPNWKSKENSNQIAVRYQLLREVWLTSD